MLSRKIGLPLLVVLWSISPILVKAQIEKNNKDFLKRAPSARTLICLIYLDCFFLGLVSLIKSRLSVHLQYSLMREGRHPVPRPVENYVFKMYILNEKCRNDRKTERCRPDALYIL